LFAEHADLGDSLTWLRSLYFKSLEENAGASSGVRRVTRFLNQSSLLPPGVELHEVNSDHILFTDGNGAVVRIEDMSDGFRSVLSLVLDILRHLTDHSADMPVFSDDDCSVVAPGVALIDEVDVHLHPSWQQSIGAWFKKCFPNFQFIVATHSLLVCQSADSVFLLPPPGSDDPGFMLSSAELKQIRYGSILDGYGTGVFGKDLDESPDAKRLSRRLAELNLKQIEAGLDGTEREEQLSLRSTLPTSNPLFVKSI
jgi:hypothetical protein